MKYLHTQQLVCFVCVADRLNFSKAAEELFLSTPTVTHHIKTLETELNTTLFIRNSKMVRLTKAGSEFYRDAVEILGKIEIAEKKLQNIANPNTFTLNIGCTSNAEFTVLRKPLTILRSTYPDMIPHIFVNDYFSLKNSFENGQTDLILSTRNMSRSIGKCSFLKLCSVSNYAVFSKDSELSQKEELHFEDLEEKRLIVLHPKFIPFEYSDGMRDRIMTHGATHLDIPCENDQAGIFLAECGFGTVIFPEFCIPPLPDTLTMRPFEKNAFFLDYGITYHKNPEQEYIRTFLDIFSRTQISFAHI